MKKVTSISTCLLFALTALLITGKISCNCLGYRFDLTNSSVFAITLALLSVGTAILFLIFGKTESKWVRILLMIAAPLSMINIHMYSLIYATPLIYVCTIIAAVHTLFLALWHGRKGGITILWSIISTVILAWICYIGIFCLMIGSFGDVSVVQTVESPSAIYRAEVHEIDQGALGGDTVVYVYESRKCCHTFLFTVFKKPQTVYRGSWYEAQSMQISWADDRCLLINSTEYPVN